MNLLQDDVKKLYFKYLFPTFGSTIVMSIYSTVDLVAVGIACGPTGNAALACVSPIWSIMISLALLLGVGGSVRMSHMRGAGNSLEGDRFFTTSLCCAGVLSVLVTVFCLCFQSPLLRLFGADAELLPLAMKYSRWIMMAVPFFIIGTMLLSFIRNDGAPVLCTVAVIGGGVVNMLGDYLFVFPLGMGISGAGLATALGLVFSTLVLLSYFLRKSCKLRLAKITEFFPRFGRIIAAGFASFATDLAFGVMMVLFNRQIMVLGGSTELAIYGTISNVAILFQSLFYSVGNATIPIASTNYGAKQYDRVKRVLGLALGTALVMSLLFTLVTELFPGMWLDLYLEVNDAIMAIGPASLRAYGVSFLFMGVNVVSSFYLQSVLQARQSILVTLARGFVLGSILVFLLPPLLGPDAIWWTMPIAEFLTMLMAAVFVFRQQKQLK